MSLNPDAVELPLDRRRRAGADLREGVLDAWRAGGQHRLQRVADLEADLGECFAAARQCRLGGPGKRATEHDRAADFRDGDAGGLRDGVGHHAVESALPKLAGEQPDEEVLLVLGGATEDSSDDALALDDRAPAGDGANP